MEQDKEDRKDGGWNFYFHNSTLYEHLLTTTVCDIQQSCGQKGTGYRQEEVR